MTGSQVALPLAFAIGALGALGTACGKGTSGFGSPDAHAPSDAEAPLGAPGLVGSSIALVDKGSRLAVVNPDQGSVSFLDPASLEVQSTTTVGGEPHALLEPAPGTLLVANYRDGEVVVLDEATGEVTKRVSACAGAYGLAAAPDGSWVAVTCEWEQSLKRLDVKTYAVTTLASGLRRPRSALVLGDVVYAADYIGGLIHAIQQDGTDKTTSLVPTSAPYRPALTLMSANLASSMIYAFGGIQVAHVLENNTGNSSAEPVAEDYGSVKSTNPKINPSVTTLGSTEPVLYAKYDGGSRVYSGPSALASFGSRYLLVAHVSTANVAVIDTEATTPDTRSVGTFPVGFGPSGIVVDEAHKVAYVDNAIDQSVSRLDLDQSFSAPATTLPRGLTLLRKLPSPYSQDALDGRRNFFDATNTQITPSGVVACASCHPGGSDDGLVWFIHTSGIPLKRRRTPHLANSRSDTAPFHWNGQFHTMGDLAENTITELMAGLGLEIDVSQFQPYIDEIVTRPVLPVTDASAVARGEKLFRTGGATPCINCHTGAAMTDGLLHTVLNPMSLEKDDVIPESNTPALHGLFMRAPFYHDGRATSLTDALTRPDAKEMLQGQVLSSVDVSDLVAYLNSL